MTPEELSEWRLERLIAASLKAGGDAELGRLLKHKSGAQIGHMRLRRRPITEKTVHRIEELPGFTGWFDPPASVALSTPPGSSGSVSASAPTDGSSAAKPIDLENNPDYPSVRRVKFKLSAGASGFGIEYSDEEGAPIVFQRQWYEARGLRPDKLFAIKVANGSMEPGLYHDDTVVVNTDSIEPKDGVVFAVNYEGEMVIKRLVRDSGQWWLASDNPNQQRYPRKVCDEHSKLIGEIVHKQSERI